MQEALASLRFSRTLAAVLLSNLASLVVLNALELRPFHLLLVYPTALCLFGWLLHRARVRRARINISRWMIAYALAFAAFLTVPRLPYLLEWVPGNVVLAQADDYGRLAELISMTLSDRYPLPHFANQHYLLSHYYTPFYPIALLKTLIPVLTLKDSIVIGNALYHFLLVLSLLELSSRLFSSRRSFILFFFLCTLFGGFDWLLYPRLLFTHAERWPQALFPALREISSYFTGLFWVVHHFTAFYSVVLAFLFVRCLWYRGRAAKPLLLGLLLINAFYSSVFALLPAFLIGFPELWWLLKRTWKTRVLPLLILVFCGPLFLYTHRVQTGTLSITPPVVRFSGQPLLDGPATFAAYLVLVSVIDLAGIPLLLLALFRRFNRKERRYFAASLLFLVSTYFIASIGWNNYCMRGMLLPSLVFYYLFAKYSVAAAAQHGIRWPRWRPAVATLAILLSVGTLKEWCFLLYQPLMYSNLYWELQGKPPPSRVTRFLLPVYRELARDRNARYYRPTHRDLHTGFKYNAEKMIQDLPVEQMFGGEKELLRYPRRTWFW
jgi:hypothetical protein